MPARVGPMITFNNGAQFPQFGLGTWQAKGDECKPAIRAALDAGYRHIDTAFAYENEKDIGEVVNEYIKAGKFKRSEIFITTKLFSTYFEPKLVAEGFNKSFTNLNLGYIDLFLVHSSMAMKNTGIGGLFPTNADGSPAILNIPIEDTWKEVEKLIATNKVKSIGISNFNAKQVERICKIAKIKPVTNQVECNAYFSQQELQDACKKFGVTLTSYATIGSPGRPSYIKKEEHAVLLEDPLIKKLATKYKKTPGQVIIRQMTQRGILVIPKSSNPKRIKENSEIFDFELTASEMGEVAKLDKNMRMFELVAFKDHPEYPA